MMRTEFRCCLVLTLVFLATHARSEDQLSPHVGMAAAIEQRLLPGTELVAKPLEDDATPIVLRITGTFPHGDSFRYDFTYYGLEPGEYDLRDFLVRKNGSALGDVPAIPVEILSGLPPGQLTPKPLADTVLPNVGGYTTLLIAAGVLWVIGLLALLFLGRKKKAAEVEAAKPLTLAERLRPLVEQARTGELSKDEQAKLERLLLSVWRRRLDLGELSHGDAIAHLRSHEDAGGLLRELEKWLHKPGAAEEVDVAALLKPYESMSDDP